MTTSRRPEHPVANIGFPGVVGIGGGLALTLFGCWPMVIWHRTLPDGSISPTVTAWVVCGIWWALIALAGVLVLASHLSQPPAPQPPAKHYDIREIQRRLQ